MATPAALKERAVYLTTETDKALRAGAPTRQLQEKQQGAVDAAMAAGVPLCEISIEADERFIQHIRDCQNPDHQPTLDETGDRAPAA
ncbi:hypothetical protein [Streptomyces sp. NPDC002853]